MFTTDAYSIYVRTYGKVASGAKLTDSDYGVSDLHFEPYCSEGQVAVAMAAQDVSIKALMRPRTDFEAELKRMLGTK